MKRAIAFLFGFAAAVVLFLAIYEAQANPAFSYPRPICKDGVCTIPETEWLALKRWHMGLLQASIAQDEEMNGMANELTKLRNIVLGCLYRKA